MERKTSETETAKTHTHNKPQASLMVMAYVDDNVAIPSSACHNKKTSPLALMPTIF